MQSKNGWAGLDCKNFAGRQITPLNPACVLHATTNRHRLTTNNRRCVLLYAAAALILSTVTTALAKESPATNQIRIVEIQGKVQVLARNTADWRVAQTNQWLHAFDRLRTGPDSRVALRWSGQSVMSFGASTEVEVLEPHETGADNGLHLLKGITSFFHRDRPGRIRVITRGAIAGVEGTEFVLAVNETERSTVSVIDGKVSFGNEHSTLVLTNGEQATAAVGQEPVRGTGFIANNLLQWALYYPVVLDPADLNFSNDEQKTFSDSLIEYRRGDVLQALANFPSQPPASDSASIYHAALLLGVGQVEKAQVDLASLQGADARAVSLRTLVAAVKRQAPPASGETKLTSELLARSYYEQSRAIPDVSLKAALDLAKRAAQQSPESGFAWARVAELEFSFGRTDKALEALNKSFEFTPRNPEALSLKGFILAGQNKPCEAIDWFDRAIAVDGAMANAWLGRGLCKIQMNDIKAGKDDLLVAAALEPQRAELRSYLGKAYATVNDYPRAEKELRLAKKLDPNDPTAWLYSALVKRNKNEINDAIRDLETSQALNNNLSVYRSQLLLDQDQAVRSANLASIYRDAGMNDVAYREASRSVNYDYGNYSAHLFLANSYAELIDPDTLARRYETPKRIEYLLANLLSPASAGTLTPELAENQNSRFFEQNRLGVTSDTTYLSRGAWIQRGEQYGISEKFSYNVGADYLSDRGQQSNQQNEQRILYLTLKEQITPKDSLFGQVVDADIGTGNLFQYYTYPKNPLRYQTFETQHPTAYLGYHHEWSPGVHTLFLASRTDDDFGLLSGGINSYLRIFPDDPSGKPTLVSADNISLFPVIFTNRLTLYSGELQQIWQTAEHNTVLGCRVQHGEQETKNFEQYPSMLASAFVIPVADQDIHTHFDRLSLYAYHNWNVLECLQLDGGLAYDVMKFPEAVQGSPLLSIERSIERFSPKAGLIWTPLKLTTVRFAYTTSVAGSQLDQSLQIEPSQVAGFPQAFRSIIPESVASESAGATFETFNLSLEQKLPTGTYLAIYGTILNSNVRKLVNTYDYLIDEFDFARPSGMRDKVDYTEDSLQFTANQLVGTLWSFGAQYRVSDATFQENFYQMPDHTTFGNFQPRHRNEAVLHQVRLSSNFNHPSGFFALAEGIWNSQNNEGYVPDLPGDDFWQMNIFGGYRFLHRRAEVTLALLNVADQDYHLNPLNLHEEFPHRRTLMTQLRLSF